ncbi:MAG: DUF2304 domain-containing protein [Pseudomonadota bacterium]
MLNLVDILIENRIQVFSIIGSISLILIIFKLIKRKKLKEEYSLLWLGCGSIFLFFSIFKPLLQIFADSLGIIYAPSALLLMLIVSAFLILIQFSVVISKLSESNKNLIQEVGILKAEFKKLQSLVKDVK